MKRPIKWYIAVHLNLLKKNLLCKEDSESNDKGKNAVSRAPLMLLIWMTGSREEEKKKTIDADTA